eukprot:g37189.t1
MREVDNRAEWDERVVVACGSVVTCGSAMLWLLKMQEIIPAVVASGVLAAVGAGVVMRMKQEKERSIDDSIYRAYLGE